MRGGGRGQGRVRERGAGWMREGKGREVEEWESERNRKRGNT